MDPENFDSPSWDDFQDFWNRCSLEERMRYVTDTFDCGADNKIAQAIASSLWDQIPDYFQETLEGGHLGIDVFDVVNGWDEDNEDEEA